MTSYIKKQLEKRVKRVLEILNSQKREGDGVVMCVGGKALIDQAHTVLRGLSDLGNILPIQIFHDGDELQKKDKDELQFGHPTQMIEFVDLSTEVFCQNKDIRGFQIKAYALLFTRFRNVVYMDADLIPLTILNEYITSQAFEKYGAIFFPDYWVYGGRESIYAKDTQSVVRAFLHTEIEKGQPEIESGLFVLDTVRHKRTMAYIVALNDLRDYFYNYFYGDKELFRFAFMLSEEQFFMLSSKPKCIGVVEDGEFYGFGMVHMLSNMHISHVHMTILPAHEVSFTAIRDVSDSEPISISYSYHGKGAITFPEKAKHYYAIPNGFYGKSNNH